MVNINSIKTATIKSGRNFVSQMSRGDGLLPIILLEAAVTGGRTYHAYKRDGFVEARERLTEETLGAIFWFCGVDLFSKMGDVIGKKYLSKKYENLKDVNFDVGKDAARNPLKNFMHKMNIKDPKALATFKATKMAASLVLANIIVGFVVPKINQAITKKYQQSITELNTKHPQQYKHAENIDKFVQKTKKDETKEKQENKTAFKGGIDTVLNLTNKFETQPTYKLIATDVGVAGGRGISARNKDERIEVLFRDLSSIYFYMFCRSHINKGLNWLQDRKTERVDPTTAHEINQHLETKGVKDISSEQFLKQVLGKDEAEVKKAMSNIKFEEHGIIKLEEFLKQSKADKSLVEKATRMSQLQPKIGETSILTKAQVQDLFRGGHLFEPELLDKVYRLSTGEKMKKGQLKVGKSADSMRFVPESELESLKAKMIDYVKDIAKKAEKSGSNVTENILRSVKKANFIKNAVNLGFGFAVCGYFLSSAIPKIQYWITYMRTGENKFPGVKE